MIEVFTAGKPGYGVLQLYSGAQPANPDTPPTGALLWEWPVLVKQDRRTATKQRRAPGVSDGMRRRGTTFGFGRRKNDERRVATKQRRARGIGIGNNGQWVRRGIPNRSTEYGRRANDVADHKERRGASLGRFGGKRIYDMRERRSMPEKPRYKGKRSYDLTDRRKTQCGFVQPYVYSDDPRIRALERRKA